MNIRSFAVAISLSLVAAGCGGGGSPSGTSPAAPTGLAVTLAGTSANLSWADTSSDESGFEIERFTSTGGWAVQFSTGANATTATSTNLEPGATYGFRLRSFNSAGKSSFSNEVTLSIPALEQPNRNPAAPYAPNYLSVLSTKGRWQTTTLTYSVDKGVDSRTADAVKALVAKSAARWNTATNGFITLNRIDDAAAANIKITFVSPGDPDVTGGDAGSTSYTLAVPSPIVNRDAFTGVSIKVRADIPDGQFVPLIAHELGHALGIGGHSNDSSDTMFGVVTASTLISARDVNTLAKLYLTTD